MKHGRNPLWWGHQSLGPSRPGPSLPETEATCCDDGFYLAWRCAHDVLAYLLLCLMYLDVGWRPVVGVFLYFFCYFRV